MCGERNTGLFSDGMTEKKRGTGMGYPEMTSSFMADCVIVCFLSIWFVLSGSFLSICQSVYLSVCLFVSLSICHSVSFGFYG
jgi:hypothetical protein